MAKQPSQTKIKKKEKKSITNAIAVGFFIKHRSFSLYENEKIQLRPIIIIPPVSGTLKKSCTNKPKTKLIQAIK